jgi:hypothetical protein
MNKIWIAFLLLLGTAGFSACSKGDGTADYGFTYIYMPQATVSGGLNNNYAVPSGEGEYTYNFKIENGKLEIFLGILRAGDMKGKSFTVDVTARPDTVQQIVASGSIEHAFAFPNDLYSIPSQVSVKNGESSAAFYMTVPISDLQEASYTGKKLVAAISIANPSRYELSDTNTTTIVVLDVDAIRKYF